MTGLGGLYGDVGRFKIADLTDHDDVRVLPQKCLKCHGERHPRALIHADLIDAGQGDLGRVLGRGNVDTRFVQYVQAGIERHGFA